jgi:hypothetical protein
VEVGAEVCLADVAVALKRSEGTTDTHPAGLRSCEACGTNILPEQCPCGSRTSSHGSEAVVPMPPPRRYWEPTSPQSEGQGGPKRSGFRTLGMKRTRDKQSCAPTPSPGFAGRNDRLCQNCARTGGRCLAESKVIRREWVLALRTGGDSAVRQLVGED